MRILLSLLLIITLSNLALAQTTAIPDPNFEQALINLGLDTGTPNGTVPTANINTVTSLNVNSLSINDLTGIEDFIALSELICWGNQLTNLDVTNNSSLAVLECSSNQLTSLDITINTNLIRLFCWGNQLTSLDINNNITLTQLNCRANQLTSLDVANNTALTILDCHNNQLTNLDVTNNTALNILECSFNQLTNLDVSNNTALVILDCTGNQLTSLDVTNNTTLTRLECSFNQLNCLNVRNGINTIFIVVNTENNPNLTCIEVDDSVWSATNWPFIDLQTSFSTNCNNSCSSPVGIEENSLSSLSIYPNPTQGNISIDLRESTSSLKTTLINSLGQVIQTQNYSSTNFIEMNIDAPKGLYFLQIETDEGDVITKKVIKE